MNCQKCFHPKENHAAICNGSLTCLCEKFVPSELVEFAQAIEKYKSEHRTIYDKVKFMLEKIPTTRNCHEKTMADVYREIWYGFKIRASGTTITTEQRRRMPGDDTINREKRFVKADNPHLRTYDSETLWHQSALYIAIKEMAVGI